MDDPIILSFFQFIPFMVSWIKIVFYQWQKNLMQCMQVYNCIIVW